MVKLTNEEIKWLIIRVGSGFFTVKQAAQVYGGNGAPYATADQDACEMGEIPRLNPKRWPKSVTRSDSQPVLEWKKEVVMVTAKIHSGIIIVRYRRCWSNCS